MIVVTEDNAQQVLQELESVVTLAVDTETTGLEQTDRPFIVSIADASNVYLVYVEQIAILRKIFSKQRRYVFQNAKFDMRMLEQIGIFVQGEIVDTEVVARLHCNSFLKYSLEAQAKRYGYAKDMYIDQYIKDHKLYRTRVTKLGDTYKTPSFDAVPKEVIESRAGMDARITYDLFMIYLLELPKTSLPVYHNEIALTPVCRDMERIGVKVDKEYTQAARLHEIAKVQEVKLKFKELTLKDFEDKKSVLVPVFAQAGDKVPMTEKGNPSLTDDILESFTSPAAKLVQAIRHGEKMVSTYYDNFINMSGSDWVIHSDMRQAGTRTGRFSYREPNLQNIPKEEDSTSEYVVRGCFVPRPGYVFVSMDYSQQEYRMMLAFARERDLITKVMNGEDVHQATADMLGVTRKEAKTINFACVAEGSKVLTDKGLVNIEEVQMYHKVWDGLNFVSHEGVVYNGIRETIEVEGLRATPCHVVFTEAQGQIPLGEYAAQQTASGIITTEVNGRAVRWAGTKCKEYRQREKAPHDIRESTDVYSFRESIEQTKKYTKVYDILNCGPNNRFTVSGKLVHNCVYGAGVEKLSGMLGITKDETFKVLKNYFDRLPQVDWWISHIKAKAKNQGYLDNWYGRRLFFEKEFYYTAPNHYIQGGCADVVKLAMVNMHPLMDATVRPLVQIHDQLIFEVKPESYAKLREIASIMENAFPETNGMRMKVDVSWSDKSMAERDMKKGYPDGTV